MLFDILHFVFFPCAIHTLLLKTLRRNFYIYVYFWKSLTKKRIRNLAVSVLRKEKKRKKNMFLEFFYVRNDSSIMSNDDV